MTISGSHFTGATAVTFHGTDASTFNVDNDGQITAVGRVGHDDRNGRVTEPWRDGHERRQLHRHPAARHLELLADAAARRGRA